MKTIKIITWLAAGCCAVVTTQASLILNFSGVSGSVIQFNGSSSSFQFTTPDGGPGAGHQWQISSETGSQATGSADGLYGMFAGGPFSYGSVGSPFPGYQTASVTTTAQLQIYDGSTELTAYASFADVSMTSSGSFGLINLNSVVNLSNFSYTGANADLIALANSGTGSLDLYFQFSTSKTLSQLSSGSTPIDTVLYSGSIEAVPVPEPPIIAPGALLLIGWAALRRLRK